MRPMLSLALVEIIRDACVLDELASTVDLERGRGEPGLEDLDLRPEDAAAG